MTQFANLMGSTNADLIGNDANPTFTIVNTNLGAALSVIANSTSVSNPALRVGFNANVAGATVAPLTIVASTASQAVVRIQGVFISTASINVAQTSSAFVIPVYHDTQAVWGYISASKGVA